MMMHGNICVAFNFAQSFFNFFFLEGNTCLMFATSNSQVLSTYKVILLKCGGGGGKIRTDL